MTIFVRSPLIRPSVNVGLTLLVTALYALAFLVENVFAVIEYDIASAGRVFPVMRFTFGIIFRIFVLMRSCRLIACGKYAGKCKHCNNNPNISVK